MSSTEIDAQVSDEGRDLTLPTILVAGAMAIGVVLRATGLSYRPGVANWITVFIAVTIQAFPFLVLGVAVSGALATVLPPDLIRRALPRRSALAVPVAGLAGVALPGCECASVPIAGRLVAGGAPAPAALAFLLAAPAINPVVLIATAVAFPGRPAFVFGRFAASLATAVIVGWIWTRRERVTPTESRLDHDPSGSRFSRWSEAVIGDFVHAGGYLILGAATAATLQTVIPRSVLDSVAGSGVLAVIALAVLAVILAVCSEADAFVAAGLSQFSFTARLTFLVVGPAVDVKLVAMQVATFGRSFAFRFAPLTFAVAVLCASVTGAVLS
jgi:uncharacterized protein